MTTAKHHTQEERDTATISVLMFAVFATAVSNSIIFAALSDLQDKYGFGDAGLGLIAGSGFFVGLVTQVFLAPYADSRQPKNLMVLGLLFACCGSVLFAFGNTLWQFIVARAIVGVSFGCTQPAARAVAAHLDKSRAAERLGRLAGMETAGIVGGPFLGGILLDPLGLRSTFLVFSGIALLGALILSVKHLPQLEHSSESKKLSLTLFRFPGVRIAALTTMSLFLPIGVYDALWDRYLTDRGATNFAIGLSFLLYGLPFILLSRYGGKLADKWGALRVALYAIFIVAPITGSYGLFTTPVAIIIVSMVEGVFQAISVPASQATMAAVAPPGRAAAAQGLSGASNLVAASLMAFTSPLLYGRYGPATTFIVAACLMLLISTTAQLMARKHHLL
jgi:predicted MFS family arabinose efflux permease